MDVTALLLSITLVLYALAVAFFVAGLSLPEPPRTDATPTVSVILPARNEAPRLPLLLQDLAAQDYPSDRVEIVVVDDESEDGTAAVAAEATRNDGRVKVVSTRGFSSQTRLKKRALEAGIDASTGEILLLTDADCRVPPTWMSGMISRFAPEVGLVAGRSVITGPVAWRDKIEALDFLLLQAAAYSAAAQRRPLACTGQNLAYRRKTFQEAGGFSAFANASGGDDTLFLQQVRSRTGWRVTAVANRDAATSTSPTGSCKALFTQRMRWASDALHVPGSDRLFFGILAVTFTLNLLLLVGVVEAAFGAVAARPIAVAALAKFCIDGAFAWLATARLGGQDLRIAFPLWFAAQPLYITAMGVLSFRGPRIRWGGRHG